MESIIQDQRMLTIHELGDLMRFIRDEKELTVEEIAEALSVDVEQVRKAETHYYGVMLRLRKRVLEEFTGYTLKGPFYQIRRIS